MVIVLAPVNNCPVVIFTVGALTLLCKVTLVADDALFMVRILKVVAPEIEDAVLPVKEIVLVPGVKLPLLVQLPLSVWVKLPALKVVPVAMVNPPLVVMADNAVFVFPLDSTRSW